MKALKNAISRSPRATRATLAEDLDAIRPFRMDSVWQNHAFPESVVSLHEGKPLVKIDHKRDMVSRDEDGAAHIVTMAFRAGEYLFPFAYEHPCVRKDIHGKSYPALGKTVDVRFIPGRGWFVRIIGALLSPEKLPILVDGDYIVIDAWFPESVLLDAGKGFTTILPGAARRADSPTDLEHAAALDAARSPRYVGRDMLDPKKYPAKSRKRDSDVVAIDTED